MTAIAAQLVQALGGGTVLVGDEVPEHNREDWSGLPATSPLAVVRPRTTAEVATCLRL